MKRRAAIVSMILAGASLTIALPRRAIAGGKQVQANSQTVTLVATCDAVRATGKRRQSWVFSFKVASVVEGRYEQPFVGFELYQGGTHGGERLLALVDAKKAHGMGDVAEFDRNKKIELTLELRSSARSRRVSVQDFKLV